jgi:phage tail-like protein
MPGAYLISTVVFTVKIPDIDTIGYFSSCTGLELSCEVFEYQEGGNNDFVHRLPGPVTYPNLVLSRGLTNEEALLKWFWATHTKAERKEVLLTLGEGSASRKWAFADAFPVRWTGPQIGADGRTIATETLEIAHTGLKLA